MDEVVEFINRFIEAEYQAVMATHTNPDGEAVRQAIAAAEAFVHSTPRSIVSLGIGRPPGMTSEELQPLAEEAERLGPRILYAVATYDLAGRTVHRAFVGAHRDPAGFSYDLTLNIAPVDGDLRIVGRTAVNVFAAQDRLEWEPAGGEQFPEDASPTEVVALQRPGDPVHAAHFDQLAEAAGGSS